MRNKGKWDEYYRKAEEEGIPPPWESTEPFEALVNYFLDESIQSRKLRVIELGCGTSASSCYMSTHPSCQNVSAVDISEGALRRAQLQPNSHLVKWVQADILESSFLETYKNSFDFVFDMQCFHLFARDNTTSATAAKVIADILVDGGQAMIVAGAEIEGSATLDIGPPRLRQDEITEPLIGAGLELKKCELSKFNSTPYYASKLEHPPYCWVMIFTKESKT